MEKMENMTGRSEENGRSERRISIDELIKNLTFNITSEPHVGSPSNDPLFTEDSCPNWTPPRSDAQSFATGNTHSNPFYSYPSFGNLFSRAADTDSSNSNHGSDRYFSYYSNIDSLLNTFELPLRNSHKETQASYADIVNGWMNYLPFGTSTSSTPPRPPSTPSPSSTPPLSRTPDLNQNESVSVDGNTQCKSEGSVKLSYSDVASIPPSPTVQSKLLKSKMERMSSISKPAFISKKVKSRQQHANITTGNATRLCNRIAEDIPNSIKPNAKYGLDSFENLPDKPHKIKLEHKRKNSLDSMSSDRSSGQDENQPSNKFSGIHDLGEEMVDPSYTNKTRNKKDRNCEDHLFFDPRRIFAGYKMLGSNSKAPSLNSPPTQQDRSRKNEPTLNNKSDKPSTQGPSPRRTLHINNNLRRCSSTGTSEGPTLGNENVDNEASEEEPVLEDRFKKNHCMQGSRGTNFKAFNKHTNNINTDRPPGPSKRSGNRRKREPNSFAGEVVALLTRYVKVCLMWLVSLVTDVVVMSSRLTWQLFTTVVHWTRTKLRECWYKIIIKFKPRFTRSGPFSWYNSSFSDQNSTLGLEQNIPLPSTGDEAMKRLLACKGKDPYSILGVTKDTSDEDIKKYYKRQAFLVHPDKNRQPGAEEAFKILAHAFELIGEPDKRNTYDSQMAEENVKENAWHEFSDLLSKLHDKMAEAVNTMKCDNCGSKHRRIPVDRPWYSARFCERCNVRHAVKEGDVWAESSFFGFLWYYYSCMDNVIYDITEWAACQKENFKHLQANAHHVRYRIVSGNGPHHTNPIPSDAELEEFLNQLYHQTVHGNRFCQSTGSATNGKPYGQPSGGSATNTNSKKKRKRKKN